jgi:hypothetical protein
MMWVGARTSCKKQILRYIDIAKVFLVARKILIVNELKNLMRTSNKKDWESRAKKNS